MSRLFLILGLVFAAYYLCILWYAGIHASFAWFWLGAGAVCWLISAVCREPSLQTAFLRIPVGIRAAAGILVLLVFLVFLAAEVCIVSGMRKGRESACDYLIVLGAQIKGSRVSLSLQQRLDRALAYLRSHPETIVIVSGGQGSGEDITEAQAMESYLADAGLAPERIWKEDQSVNTVQNLRLSRKLMMKENAAVGIVSNDFHIFRAVHIAKAQGWKAAGIPAPTAALIRPHYMTREALALIKDLILGNAAL